MRTLDLFARGTEWTASKIPAAQSRLDEPTRLGDWTVRMLLNHLLDSQQAFAAAAAGHPVTPNPGDPPELIDDEPAWQYERARLETFYAYDDPEVLEVAEPSLAVAFVEQLVHGWDLAVATGQDATMPPDLAEAAFELIDGRLGDDNRAPYFEPAVPVPPTASAQEKLLGYVGRRP
ncbi:MAG TPA: TIGR03086 family metal-binding protein [Acidimicrobiales bacterium]